MLHFTYDEQDIDPKELRQGDVLRRSPELDSLLKEYYSYFGNNEENQFFLVITQSCDLVPRANGVCKAKYIELAAVRPLRVVVQRELTQISETGFGLPVPVAGLRRRARFEQFLERLFNNNEHEYFYLCKEPTAGLPEDCCAFLHLTVPIKASHYDTCLKARVLALKNVFQAKLGWLVGQIYARVGTTDWAPDALHAMVEDISKESALWLDDKLIRKTERALEKWKVENPGVAIDEAVVMKLIQGLPRRRDVALERIGKVLEQSALVQKLTEDGQVTPQDLKRLLNLIGSDQQFSNVLG